MSVLLYCSTCCMLLSIWAVVQLGIMGICYYLESVTLIEDTHAHKAEHNNDYDEFIKLTKENYSNTAKNCWAVAGIYTLTLLLSCCGLQKAKSAEKKAALLHGDVEYTCRMQKEKTSSQLERMAAK